METLVEYAGPADTGGPFARLTLNSPHNRNALSTALVEQLHQGLRDAAAEPASHSSPARGDQNASGAAAMRSRSARV